MPQETLLFDTPKFESYRPLSITRLGRKWFDRVDVGDEVALMETGGDVVGTAEVIGITFAPFDQTPISWAARNHLPSVQTRYDLAEIMDEVYEDFDTGSLCTTILFDPEFR